MSSLKDIRKRISSVKNTQKITRAMKLVAAAKLRRAQSAMMELRPYAAKYREMLTSLAGGASDNSLHPLFEERAKVHTVAVLALASDRGMCGAFNGAAQKLVSQFTDEQQGKERRVVVFTLSRRMNQYVSKRPFEHGDDFGEIIAAANTETIKKITDVLVDGFETGLFDEVVIASNRFKSVIAQNPTITPLLPVVAPTNESDSSEDSRGDFLYEPDEQSLLNHVVPAYLEVQVRAAILESIAGEHAARMNAMNSATDNAAEMISSLTLQMNRARQAAITTELMEIIGGAEALK